MLSRRQIQRHRSGKASPHILAAQALKERQFKFKPPKPAPTSSTTTHVRQHIRPVPPVGSTSTAGSTSLLNPERLSPNLPVPEPLTTPLITGASRDSLFLGLESDLGSDNGIFDSAGHITNDPDIDSALNTEVVNLQPQYCRTVIMEDDDDADEEDALIEEEEDEDPDEDAFLSDHESDGDIPIWQSLNESFERDLADIGEDLPEDDVYWMRLFAYKTEYHLTRESYEALSLVFPDKEIPSVKSVKSRAQFLAGFEPRKYDCCISSCCAFTGPNADLDKCPYCDEPRFAAGGQPRKQFTYIPLIPRLVAFYHNRELAEKMRYRGEYQHDPEVVRDVMDSEHYRRLCSEYVHVDGQRLGHRHFSDRRDIALGASTDGFAPFRRRKQTCWPLIFFNYDLPPEIRFLIEFILCIGVIPGPKKPHDFDSFFWPAVEELLLLAVGVPAFDASTGEAFLLRAYLILIFGDMPAMSMVMHFKGHNGFRPCRACNITAIGDPGNTRAHTLYIPLDRSRHPAVRADANGIKKYDPANLPLRTDEEILLQAQQAQFQPNATASNNVAKQYGIKGTSILSSLSSISFTRSFPHDFMHLVFENVLTLLTLLWTGQFKGLDEGTGSYHFNGDIWDAIGAATAASGSMIPGAFGQRPPNVANNKSACTADSWCFWMLYIAPVLLSRKFNNPVYFNHFVELAKLVNICLQFEISREDITAVRQGFINWVEKYEQIYYQYLPERLSTCSLNIHALLHIADHIEMSGPVWAYWAFPMERFCGLLQPAIRNRRFPFASIDQHVVSIAHLSQIKIRHSCANLISLRRKREEIPRNAHAVPGYTTCVLLPPKRPFGSVNKSVADKIVVHLATRYQLARRLHVVRRHFKIENTEQWSKVQRLEGGDTMYASSMESNLPEDRRDATFIRYDMLVDKNARKARMAPSYYMKTFYGQLQNIIMVDMPATPDLGLETSQTLLLAVIQQCIVDGTNTLGWSFYTNMGLTEVVDMTCVQCLVGRVPSVGGKIALIDRSNNIQRSYYDPDV